MDFIDCYEILQLPYTANKDAIKTAYRQLAKTTHPDKNPEDAQATLNFQKLNDAYATLSDTKKRRIYDLEYERQTRSYLPPFLTEVRTNKSTNENTAPSPWFSDTFFEGPFPNDPEPILIDIREVEKFIRQFKSCVSNTEKEVRLQKPRVQEKEEAIRVLEEEIFTAGFEMIEKYECGAGPSNLERTREYPQIEAQMSRKVEVEAELKEEEEKLASLERQLLEFSSRLSYWEKKRRDALGRKP
ncbi:molecular chaperone [Fusarium acutatum]|uniref:Molecular chaperone n=1 Tax=Fusarium acutatum TaxID=78861 RepID=A0A8H4JD09_9HYPO|nr:molecular chaperone [Fusarium acutatum]